MNERLAKLAETAWDATAVSPDFGHPVSFAEKLSELILTEVISTIYRSDISDRKQELLVQELTHKFGLDV
jgi:hypothetical protein